MAEKVLIWILEFRGGLSYSIIRDGVFLGSKLSTVISNHLGPPDHTEQIYGHTIKSDFSSYTDLSFVNYQTALNEVESLLTKVGFPYIKLAEAYSLDKETMINHYEKYVKMSEGIVDEEYQWSKDDEAYAFFFKQSMDGIPISDIGQPSETFYSASVYPAYITVFYNKEGIIYIDSLYFFDHFKKEEEVNIINETTAFQSVIDSYSDLLLENETQITSMELNYINISSNEDVYQLTPAWVFTIVETSTFEDPRTQSTTSEEEYSWIVIDAITGEFIIKASD